MRMNSLDPFIKSLFNLIGLASESPCTCSKLGLTHDLSLICIGYLYFFLFVYAAMSYDTSCRSVFSMKDS